METNNGEPFFNPFVFGTGTNFFNVISPFGFKIEICQRLDRPSKNQVPAICGIEHIGISVIDIKKSVAFYKKLGFVVSYPIISNSNHELGPIFSCMMILNNIQIELYQFSSAAKYVPFNNQPLQALIFRSQNHKSRTVFSPSTEKIIIE